MKCREGDSQEGATCNQKTPMQPKFRGTHEKNVFTITCAYIYIRKITATSIFVGCTVARLHVNLVMEGDYVALLKQKLWKKNCRVFAG